MTDFFQPVAAVLLVLTLLGGLLYALRRRGVASFALPASFSLHRSFPNPERQMKVVERVPLGAQHALHLVRVGDRLLLIATAPGSCQMIDTIHQAGL